ncbi:HNH endonuclease [Clostridiaceae bacterium UIB06]|nr:HNH endonuclease [Clostridiaceae bacterium UIB06]
MKNYKLYINIEDKKYINNYCKVQLENDDLIRIKSVASTLSNKYALFEIMQYIKDDLKISEDKIWHGEAKYIVQLPRGHFQLVNDIYFNNCYLHQYIITKELNIDIEQLQKYIVHHIDLDKSNNDISNLWIFPDVASHIAFHQAIKHNLPVDIKEFTENYVESIINKDNVEEIKQYLSVLEKLRKRECTYKNPLCRSSYNEKTIAIITANSVVSIHENNL